LPLRPHGNGPDQHQQKQKPKEQIALHVLIFRAHLTATENARRGISSSRLEEHLNGWIRNIHEYIAQGFFAFAETF